MKTKTRRSLDRYVHEPLPDWEDDKVKVMVVTLSNGKVVDVRDKITPQQERNLERLALKLKQRNLKR